MPSFAKFHGKAEPEDAFMDTFSTITTNLSEITSTTTNKNGPGEKDLLEWITRLVKYNVPHGKLIRGRLVETVYKRLVGDVSKEKLETARILGWCVEMLHAAFLIADDIMDNGEMRRGQPCWYQVDNLGTAAINDSFMLEHLVYQLIEKHFGNSKVYSQIVNLFHNVTWKTVLGQSLDTRYSKEKCYDKFTKPLYDDIVILKTAYYTFYLPAMLAIVISEKQLMQQNVGFLEPALLLIGKLFQIQDDYFDCFADEKLLGKVGTDIQEGKCTWLFVIAKEKFTTEKQHQLLEENYGSSDVEKVAMVKKLYGDVDLENEFVAEQKSVCQEVIDIAKNISDATLQNVMVDILNKICKRLY